MIAGGSMAVEVLRCRVCESEYAPIASGTCERCFGPLEPLYDWDALAANVSHESIQPGPRLASALGLGELHLKLETANQTHSFKDRVVAVAAAKARELGIDTLACS